MADEYKDILETLAKDIADATRATIENARTFVSLNAPNMLRWEAQAREAEAAGDADLAAKKRMSIEHVKNAAILDGAILGVVVTDKTERTILALFEKAIQAI